MDAAAFPPPTFLDDGFDFGDFAFAAAAPGPSLPAPPPQPAAFAAFDDDWCDFMASPLESESRGTAPYANSSVKSSPGAWERPRGPLPLSLFGADDKEEEEEEKGVAEPPPTMVKEHQRVPSFASRGERPADLKDLIVGLYGSQPPCNPDDAPGADALEAEEDDDGFGDDGWEFKAAPSSAAGGDGIKDISKSIGSNQDAWSLFPSVSNNLNHVQSTDHVGTYESSGQSVKSLRFPPANNSAIVNLFKQSELTDDVHVPQCCSESVLSSSDLFSNNEMNSSFGTDENHSIKSSSDIVLIDFYHKLREESLALISFYKMGIKEAQKSSTFPDGKNKVTAIEREIQEILEKLQDCSLPKGLSIEEHPPRDACIAELLNSIKEEQLRDFEQQYHLAEKIEMAQGDVSLAIELYKHSESILHTLELASKEENSDYVGAWYSMLLSCAQELQHGAVLWQESCHANICDQVISKGIHYFIALGEIYRVSQILHLSLQCFKPWVLADPGMLSKMLACWDSCTNAWTNGLETALGMAIDNNHSDKSVAKALLESIVYINKLEVADLQDALSKNGMACRLTLLPTSFLPGMRTIVWNCDHYFTKVANLWTNRISPDLARFSPSRAISTKSAA